MLSLISERMSESTARFSDVFRAVDVNLNEAEESPYKLSSYRLIILSTLS